MMQGAAYRRSMRGLDVVALSIAGVQTGWGPFVAAFLTAHKWTQGEIGLALSVGTLTGIVSQLPAGALVDRMRHKKTACAIATVIISAGALMIALVPKLLFVLIAEACHGFASCMLTPGIAAISLILIGDAAVGERLGRNARFAAIGNGCAAAIMGLSGKLLPEASVFWLAAALGVPALYALRIIRLPPATAQITARRHADSLPMWKVLKDRRLLIFAVCAVLFFLANSAMLPLAASEVTMRASGDANAIIAACIVVPQVIVAVLSPWVGRAAERWGRRPILLLGFAALPVRGVLLAVAGTPTLLVPIQALDGVSAAVFGVMLPLVAADLTRRSGHFNLAMSAVGLAAGLGATLSTLAAGQAADAFGSRAAFMGLTACGVAALALVWLAMPETRGPDQAVLDAERNRARSEAY
jgi:MFS family permease